MKFCILWKIWIFKLQVTKLRLYVSLLDVQGEMLDRWSVSRGYHCTGRDGWMGSTVDAVCQGRNRTLFPATRGWCQLPEMLWAKCRDQPIPRYSQYPKTGHKGPVSEGIPTPISWSFICSHIAFSPSPRQVACPEPLPNKLLQANLHLSLFLENLA